VLFFLLFYPLAKLFHKRTASFYSFSMEPTTWKSQNSLLLQQAMITCLSSFLATNKLQKYILFSLLCSITACCQYILFSLSSADWHLTQKNHGQRHETFLYLCLAPIASTAFGS